MFQVKKCNRVLQL